ncbi:MAG: hypothetical protein M1817_002155 [Caeruleum heppii]|nr:MAG: hypothetical protein M1817_002155 [Caeruleum heppii]
MFATLNRFIARLDADSPAQASSGHGLYGFQVLRNTNDSLPIEPWFDFIIGINGRQIDDSSTHLFAQEVRNCAGNVVNLGLWSAKGQRVRELSVPVPTSPPSLGLALQWTPLSTTEDVWHILDVAPDSPADKAGLLPYGDYIIGTPSGIVRGEAGLGELVEDHLTRPLPLQIYNHEYNLTRLLTIHPSRTWGGSGALGCVLGYGALHRLPAPLTEPPQAPGETLFAATPDTETSRFSNEDSRPSASSASFVPAMNHPSSPPPPSGSPAFLVPTATAPPSGPAPSEKRPARKARVGGLSPSRAMDEYFKEGEEKSRAVDRAPSPKNKGGVAPPPKAGGGPPKATADDSEKQDEQEEVEGDGKGNG